jgi:hypothetical protein
MTHTALETQIRTAVRRTVLSMVEFSERRCVEKLTELTSDQLAARAAFVARWEALEIEGRNAGYLTDVRDYDSVEVVPETATTFVDGVTWLETEAEYEARVNAEVDRRAQAVVKRALAYEGTGREF